MSERMTFEEFRARYGRVIPRGFEFEARAEGERRRVDQMWIGAIAAGHVEPVVEEDDEGKEA